MLDRLLDLCGYSRERIERERSRVQKASGKAGINDEDVRRGAERIATYFDVELQGVRKFLGVYLGELVDLILSRDEKRRVLYSMLPSLGGNPLAAVNVATDDCYAGFPDICVTFFFGQVP